MPASDAEHSVDKPVGAYTSSSTERLTTLARAMLANAAEGSSVEQALAELGGSLEHLTDEQRAQFDEIVQLLQDGPERNEVVEQLSRDATIRLEPSADEMQLRLTIQPAVGHGRAATMRDVAERMQALGVQHGILKSTVERCVAEAREGRAVSGEVVVRGRRPTAPKPGRVRLFGRPRREAEAVEIELDGQADRPVEREAVWHCREGDVVLRIEPPIPGRPGYTVFGRKLPAATLESPTVTVGDNVEADGSTFRAKTAGVILYERGRIEVRRMLVVTEDVTGQSAPIDFDGDVHVRASVRNHGRITASRDIRIDGSVEIARIESTGGSITLKHGVAGQQQAVLRAAKSIEVGFAENATLFAGEDIRIGIGAMHSRLIAGQAIFLSRGRGQLVGGTAMAGSFLEAKQLGAPGGAWTEVLVGLPRKAMEWLGQLDGEIARLRTKQQEAADLADKLQRSVGDPRKLKDAERQAYTQLRQFELVCDLRISAMLKKRDQVMTSTARAEGGRVDVLEKLMPRVMIRLGDAELETDEQRKRCRIVYDPEQQRLEFQTLR